MYCDFKTVTDILYISVAKSTVKSFNNFLNNLFTSYINDRRSSEFDASESSKLSTGARVPSKKWAEYYKLKDRSVMIDDIALIIPLLTEKENLHKSLYELICGDEYISDEYSRHISENYQPEYTDDTALSELICEAVTFAVTRPYKKNKGEKYYHVVSSAQSAYKAVALETNTEPTNVTPKLDISKEDLPTNELKDLFSNTQYIPPCEFFCGRDEELEELHTLVKNKSKVTVVGVATVGKSEFVRAYIEKYRSEYGHIGYYFYSTDSGNGISARDLRSIIIGLHKHETDDTNEHYQNNLILLSSLGKKALLVIDSFNVPASHDSDLPDILRLKCDVILISHMNYDDMTVYKLREFRRVSDAYNLIQSYYSFSMSDHEIETQINRLVSITRRHPFLLDLCGRQLRKGLETPSSLVTALVRKDWKIMKARIPAKKDGQFKEKADYHDHVARLLKTADLTETDKYVLSYMRFAPESGISKLLFAELTAIDDINVIENLIEKGFIQEAKGGIISIPSIVKDIIENDIIVTKEEFAPFAERFFALEPDSAPQSVLSEMADKISVGEYLNLYEPNRFKGAHLIFSFNHKIGDILAMDLVLSAMAGMYDGHNMQEICLFNADKKLYFEALKHLKEAETLKEQIEMVDKRFHSGEPLPKSRQIVLSEDEIKQLGLEDQ